MKRDRALASLALALGAVVAMPQPAHADESVPVSGIAVHHGDGDIRQAVHIADLYPTAVRDVVFFVDGDNPIAARRMEFRAGDVVDFDNGCNRPEQNTGDTTCTDEAGQGELSQYLELELTAGRETSDAGDRSCAPADETTATTLVALQTDPVVVGLPDDEGVLCVLAAFTHAERDGDNVTQTDSTEFDLLLRFDSTTVDEGQTGNPETDDPDTEVLGTRFENSVTPSTTTTGELDLGLPRTGLPIGTLMLGSGGLLGAGAILLSLSSRRSKTKAVPDGA